MLNSSELNTAEFNEPAVAQGLDKVLEAMQLQNPPSVCRAFPWDWPPACHKGTKPTADSFSSFHPTGGSSRPPAPSALHKSFFGCLFLSIGEGMFHTSLPSIDRGGKCRARALLLWGPHPVGFPVNSNAVEPLEVDVPPGEAHLWEPQGGPRGRRERLRKWGASNSWGEEKEGWLAPVLPNLISVHDCPTV